MFKIAIRGACFVLAGALVVGGCTTTDTAPATQRGFFGGLGAAVSGADERRAATLEADAANAEQRNRQLSARVASANQQGAITSGQVRAAEQRLANIQNEMLRQRQRLAALRSANSVPPGEATQLNSEIDAIDAERRAAAASASSVSPAKLQSLEDRTKAVNATLAKLGAV